MLKGKRHELSGYLYSTFHALQTPPTPPFVLDCAESLCWKSPILATTVFSYVEKELSRSSMSPLNLR